MIINIPKDPNVKDIFDYGFGKNLIFTRVTPLVESTTVYNQIEDRMSALIPASQQITSIIPGLLVEEI